MSKLKCQVKSKCLNEKTYSSHLPAGAKVDDGTHSGANF